MNRFFTHVLFLMLFFVSYAKSQNNCDQNIKKVEGLFENGDYENATPLLEKSIKECDFSKKEKEYALELLAKLYLEQDDLLKAEYTVKSLLINNPHYELKSTESHEDFMILAKKFDSHPLISVGIRNAALQPKFRISKTYSILDNIDYNSPYRTSKTILLYHAWGEYEFRKSIAVNIAVVNFSLEYNRRFYRDADWEMNYQENLSFIEVPLCVRKYFFSGKNVLPYIAAGMGYLRLTEATAISDISYSNEDVFTSNKTEYTSTANSDVLIMRNRNNYEWIAGAGIGFKFKNLAIFIDSRLSRGLNSLTNPSKRFSNEVLTNDYFYIDNAMKLNKFELGLSISYTLKNSIRKVR